MATTSERSRVLVVDDEPQITRVLRTVLTSQGYQVQTAAEGESALASFTEWRPELVITVRALPSDDRDVKISVSDQGPGIPLELRERVFEKFFRVPAREPLDPSRAGAGLGLPIARRLVDAQGGRIWIDAPESGRGTVASLLLPVAAEPIDAAPQPTPGADAVPALELR